MFGQQPQAESSHLKSTRYSTIFESSFNK